MLVSALGVPEPVRGNDAVVVELLERLAQVGDHLLVGVGDGLAEEVQVPSTERARALDAVGRRVVDAEDESTLLETHLLQRSTHILVRSILVWYRCSRTRETTLLEESLGSQTFRSMEMYAIDLYRRVLKKLEQLKRNKIIKYMSIENSGMIK